MRIGETFATRVYERIEPIVKVADRRPAVLLGELSNLVITPQWERHIGLVLDAYAHAADREDEQGIGIWISGFYGSGKSLLLKVLGALLEGGAIEGQPVHRLFLDRLPPGSADLVSMRHNLEVCGRMVTTTAVGGNLHAMQASHDDPLALICFKLFAGARGYTHNWPLAWAIEHPVDDRGLTEVFRARVAERSGLAWARVAEDPEFHLDELYGAAADVLPEKFGRGETSVEQAVSAAVHSGIDPEMFVKRLRRWCETRDSDGRCHKVLLQLDELGQWIAGPNASERTMQVQALVETAAVHGQGRVWVGVTAHGDIQALQENIQQEYYRKINQRFALQGKLSNDDISQVVEERVLRKTQEARQDLQRRFEARSGDLTDLGTLDDPQRVYPAPTAERFALFYPYLPWTVAAIPDVAKGVAQAAGHADVLTGATRTMIGAVQGALIETPGLLEQRVGRLLALADLYGQLATDAPIETKTDLNRVRDTVEDATDFTVRVAQALYLLGEAEYIPALLDNIVRAVVDTMDATVADLRASVAVELDRLVAAGYAKRVGERWVFLSTQQRSFQDRVRARREQLLAQTFELSQGLKDYDGEEALRFDRVPTQYREMALRMEIDGRIVRNPSGAVSVRVFSPFQRALDPRLGDDAALKQQSAQEPDHILFRMSEMPELRRAMAIAIATRDIADEVLASPQSSEVDKDVARQAKQIDLASHRDDVRRLLAQAVRGGGVFFRGSFYQLAPGESASAMVRGTLAHVLPAVYARLGDCPQRIANEEAAVKAALAGNTSQSDLKALGVYRADGTLNDAHPLISALRGRLPAGDAYQPYVSADALRSELERPPFGWDPNAVKVALALLLRASACRLIDGSRQLVDPADPDVARVLTKESGFKTLRVQGVPSELDVVALQHVRGYTEAMFGVKPDLVAASLHSALGEHLARAASRADDVRRWAVTAQCPLPLQFESGGSVVAELLNVALPAVRLARFRDEAESLLNYVRLLEDLVAFQREHGASFREARDFFIGMVNAGVNDPVVDEFVRDWRALEAERSLTQAQRWPEVQRAYRAAREVVVRRTSELDEQTRARLAEVESGLEGRIRAAGVPDEQVEPAVEGYRGLYGDLKSRTATPATNLSEARGRLTLLTEVDMRAHRYLRDLAEQYRVLESEVLHLSWRDVAGTVEVSTAEDVDAAMARLRATIASHLAENRTVVIE